MTTFQRHRQNNCEFDDQRLGDKCIAHLKFLSNFYTKIIEERQFQMNAAHQRFLRDRDDLKAYDSWTGSKIKICELYECWLRELAAFPAPTFDDVARTMHAMMSSDCYWFLAKMNRQPFDGRISNFARACETLESVFPILRDALHPSNAFYVHVVRKYARLVEDYRGAVGESTLSGTSKHVPAHMTAWDIYKCREASRICFQHISQLRGISPRSEAKNCETAVFQFSRMAFDTAV